MNRGTYDNPTRCNCAECQGYGWSHLPWWVHTPFEVYRVLLDGEIHRFTRAEFKQYLAAGALLDLMVLDDMAVREGNTRLTDQVQGGYLDWETYWTLHVIDKRPLRNMNIAHQSLKEMESEEETGMNFSFDDEADGVFLIVFKKNGRRLTKNGIWITKGGKR